MVYNNQGGFILQEKGKESEDMFEQIKFKGNFEHDSSTFPLISDDFMIFQMYARYDIASPN